MYTDLLHSMHRQFSAPLQPSIFHWKFVFICIVLSYIIDLSTQPCTMAEFLDEIQTKVLRVFLLAIHSHLYILP
jgi:hypothetical protein